MKLVVKEILFIVILVIAVSIATGDFVLKKTEHEFEGKFEYLGAIDDKQYYAITGEKYYQSKIYELENGKRTFLYEGTYEDFVLLEDTVLISQTSNNLLHTLTSIDIHTHKKTERTYKNLDSVLMYDALFGESEEVIYYMVTENRTSINDLRYRYSICEIDKETLEMLYCDEVLQSDTGGGWKNLYLKNNESYGLVLPNNGLYDLYEIDVETKTVTLLSTNDNELLLDWDGVPCAISITEGNRFECITLSQELNNVLTNAIDIYWGYQEYFIATEGYISFQAENYLYTYNELGQQVGKSRFTVHPSDIYLYDNELLYFELVEMDLLIIINSKVRLVQYDPLTGETTRSKRLDYNPDYIEVDGGV